LNVTGTLTIFINGRSRLGGDPPPIEQYLDFELDRK
jgi:hypothetical protein